MTIEHVEVLVEEPSMEAALRQLLPKILGEVTFEVYQHQCKNELLERLPVRLKGYASWLPESWRIVVIVDRDNDNCEELKERLEEAARKANLKTKSSAKRRQYAVLNRLAIEELEAWYFGDWQAVKAAYPRVNGNIPLQAKYRAPDDIKGGTWEALLRVMQNAGYFKTGLRKIEIARSIGAQLEANRNSSPSFQKLVTALADMLKS